MNTHRCVARLLMLAMAVLILGAGLIGSRLQAADRSLQRDRTAVAEKLAAKTMMPALRKAAAAEARASGRTLGVAGYRPVMEMPMPMPDEVPHYFGPYPNYANSPMPTSGITDIMLESGGSGYTAPVVTVMDLYSMAIVPATANAVVVDGVITDIQLVDGGSGYTAPMVEITDATGSGAVASAYRGAPYAGGIRKFIDGLPGVGPGAANEIGQYMPVAVRDSTTYPDSDYYEIAVVQYKERMHSDLPETLLRGYVQLSTPEVPGAQIPLFNPDGSPILKADGTQALAVDRPHYMGPIIIARRDTPVRIKFSNLLPTGSGGDLFVPVDTTVMGSGMGHLGGDVMHTQNRAAVHLHGNNTVWISDGTPHQWITPANEDTPYPKGVAVQNVPDMPDPGDGSMTLYYTNQHSARLLFYHDHSWGITRLNVYIGEAAGYLVTDDVEDDLINGTNNTGVNPANAKLLPDIGIPLVIQDKSFVDANTIGYQDPTWRWGSMSGMPVTGDLWLPHVYMPNQHPWDPSGMNAFGRWHYGPWFWPPTIGIMHGPMPNPYYGTSPWEPPMMPGVPSNSMAMEAFMDTPVINGTAYPYLEVEPKAYRFRILNAANDRFFNLQMYVADPDVTTWDGVANTEVKMVPAVPNPAYPETWPTDGREGGLPDPASAGPAFIQIGTEGGFLPKPVVIENAPVAWNLDQTNFDFGIVNQGTLILGTAERADVLVDFSQYAGKTIILYNDSPAPFPALDSRYDYYTGNPDQMDVGGTPSTLPGYGPNTRTIMQIRVAPERSDGNPIQDYDLTALEDAFTKTADKRGVFEVSQDEIIVPQAEYNSAYDKSFPADPYVRIFENAKTFTTASGEVVTLPLEPKAIQDEQGEAYDIEYGRMSGFLGLQLPFGTTGRQQFVLLPYTSPPVEIIKDTVYGTPLGAADDGTQLWKITHNGVDTHTIHVHLFNAQLVNRVAWDNAVRPPDLNELGWKETFRVNPLQDTIVAFRPVAPRNLPFDVPNSVRLIDPSMPEGAMLMSAPGGFQNPDGQPVTVLNHKVNFGWEYVYHCHILGHEEMDMMHAVAMAVAPKAPSNLAVSASSATSAVLTWTDNSINETGFAIQRAEDEAFTTGLTTFTTGADETSFTDDTVGDAATYYYRAFAVNVVGDTQTYAASAGFPTETAVSEFTDVVSLGSQTPPADPSGLTASAAGPRQVNLAWTDNSDNEVGFRIEMAVGGGAFAEIGRADADATTYSYTTAPDAATLSYRVIAYNGAGDSGPSNTATVTLPLAAPANLAAAASTSPPISVDLTWDDISVANTGFVLQRARNANFTSGRTTYQINSATATSALNVSGLSADTTYYYRIASTIGATQSSWSNAVVVRTGGLPASPSQLRATNRTTNSISMEWRDNADNEQGYQVERSTGGGWTLIATLPANTTTYTNTGLQSRRNYRYRVRAYNGFGNSSYSNTLSTSTR